MVIRVLFADQSVPIQKLAAYAFAQEKIEVIRVGNGDLAMLLLDEINPRLVIADVSLPDTDGYQLCHFIKHTPHLSHIPVLLLYWSDETFDYAKAADARADAHLMKPFESQTLIDAALALLEKGDEGRQPSASTHDPARLEGGRAEIAEPLAAPEAYEWADLDSASQTAGSESEVSFAIEESSPASSGMLEDGAAIEPAANESAAFAVAPPAGVETPKAISHASQDEQSYEPAFAVNSTDPRLVEQRAIKSPLAWAVLAIIAFSSILGIWQATRTQKIQPAAAPNAAAPQDEQQSRPGPASSSDAQPAPPPPVESSDGKTPGRRAAVDRDRSSYPRPAAGVADPGHSSSLPKSSPNANRYESRGASDNRGANNNKSDDLRGRTSTQTRPPEFNRSSATVPKNERPEQSPVRIIPIPAASPAAPGKAKAGAASRQVVKPVNGFKLIG
ncbi:MAG TPA: response regulator, partial [Blastocatellia bacterium]|nr:response regulator [Blastocatellia bacterium]